MTKFKGSGEPKLDITMDQSMSKSMLTEIIVEPGLGKSKVESRKHKMSGMVYIYHRSDKAAHDVA